MHHNSLPHPGNALLSQEYLTAEKCLAATSLRGLVRIWCAQQIPSILHFLTEQGYVNCGFMVHAPRPFPFVNTGKRKSSVLIVGAGSAGLAAAYHLRNFGHQVQATILFFRPLVNLHGYKPILQDTESIAPVLFPYFLFFCHLCILFLISCYPRKLAGISARHNNIHK